jgi:hypothetical protein
VLALIDRARCLASPFGMVRGPAGVACGDLRLWAPRYCFMVGAVQEIVEDGSTGLVAAAGDAGDMAGKVEWAWLHADRPQEMRKQARRGVKARTLRSRIAKSPCGPIAAPRRLAAAKLQFEGGPYHLQQAPAAGKSGCQQRLNNRPKPPVEN